MVKLIVFTLIAAAIEVVLLVAGKNSRTAEKTDPMAVRYIAHKVTEPSFNYIPGRQTYDEKSKRYVIDWKYEWEYQGKRHSMMFCDNPCSQYEHYLTVFPDEIEIIIHRETGKYYVPTTHRAASRNSLATLLVSMLLSWVITSLILGF